VTHVLQLVAAQTPPPDSSVGPGVGGFLAIFAIALATVLLIRSMVGHLRKVRYGPGPDQEEPGPADRAERTERTELPGTLGPGTREKRSKRGS
jgi:hypothetical protein